MGDLNPLDDLLGQYPIVITQARYQGVYEGGRWLAFPQAHNFTRDSAAFGDDVTCATWWGTGDARLIGRGDTPEAALEDMWSRS